MSAEPIVTSTPNTTRQIINGVGVEDNLPEGVSPFDCHVSLKVSGDKLSQLFFHEMVSFVDSDWPYLKGMLQKCEKCEGYLYARPRFSPKDIKQMAKLAGIGLKIKSFRDADSCCKEDKIVHTKYISNPFLLHEVDDDD